MERAVEAEVVQPEGHAREADRFDESLPIRERERQRGRAREDARDHRVEAAPRPCDEQQRPTDHVPLDRQCQPRTAPERGSEGSRERGDRQRLVHAFGDDRARAGGRSRGEAERRGRRRASGQESPPQRHQRGVSSDHAVAHVADRGLKGASRSSVSGGRDSRTARSRGGEHCDWASARRRCGRRAGGRPGGNPTRRCGSGSRGDGDEPEQQAQREEGRHVEAAVGARGGSGARPRAARTHGSPAEGIVSPAELVSGTVRVRPTRWSPRAPPPHATQPVRPGGRSRPRLIPAPTSRGGDQPRMDSNASPRGRNRRDDQNASASPSKRHAPEARKGLTRPDARCCCRSRASQVDVSSQSFERSIMRSAPASATSRRWELVATPMATKLAACAAATSRSVADDEGLRRSGGPRGASRRCVPVRRPT